ncbi:MAG: ABC transporter substrate-binding protein, partial [Candidatus Aenigmarchaeota archaeon]|nr:ABC transporter substrate-binding protein [Candidatus Aenigmarchaeota archaeon]
MKKSRRNFLKIAGGVALGAGLSVLGKKGVKAAPKKKAMPKGPVRIATVGFLTGAAAAPFGIPGNNTYKMLTDVVNKEGGILGRKIELSSFDEAGGVDAQVKLTRKLILDEKVDVILGYISSGD